MGNPNNGYRNYRRTGRTDIWWPGSMGKPDNGHGNQQRKLRSTGNGKSMRQRIRNNLNGRPRSRGEPHNGLWEHGLGGHGGHAGGYGYSTGRNGSRRNGWPGTWPGTGGTTVTGRADGSVRGIFRYWKDRNCSFDQYVGNGQLRGTPERSVHLRQKWGAYLPSKLSS